MYDSIIQSASRSSGMVKANASLAMIRRLRRGLRQQGNRREVLFADCQGLVNKEGILDMMRRFFPCAGGISESGGYQNLLLI